MRYPSSLIVVAAFAASALVACVGGPPPPAITIASQPAPEPAPAAAEPIALMPVQAGERLKLTLKNGQTLYLPVAQVKDGKLIDAMGHALPLSEVARIEVQRDLPDQTRRWLPVLLAPIPPLGVVQVARAFRMAPAMAGPEGMGLTPSVGASTVAATHTPSGLAPATATTGGGASAATATAGNLGTAAGSTGLGGSGLGGGAVGGGLGGGAIGGVGGGGGGFSLGGFSGGGGGSLPLRLTLPALLLGLWRRRRRG